MRDYDLNVFYQEDWSQETGTTAAETLTIEVSLYERLPGVTKSYPGVLFRCTVAETRLIAPDFPEEEYGSDWFIGVQEFRQKCMAMPERVAGMLRDLPDVQQISHTGVFLWWDNFKTRKWIDADYEMDLRRYHKNSVK